MSSNFSSQIQSKRQQFRNEIRRNQLDDYRRRKREQYFGYRLDSKKFSNYIVNSAATSNHIISQLMPQQLHDQIKESPFPFNKEFKTFFVQEFELRLKQNRFSLEAINQVLDKLVGMAIGELANLDKYNQLALFGVVRILNRIMSTLAEIPKNSVLRVDRHQAFKQIQQKVFYSLKTLLNGMIAEQQHQEQASRLYEQRLRMYKAMKAQSASTLSESQKSALQNLSKITSVPPITKHPLQCCIRQLSELLQNFHSLYQEADSSDRHGKKSDQHLGALAQYLRYYLTLWYLVSFMRTPLFTAQLFEFLHGQLSTFIEFQSEAVDMLMNILSNFIHNQSQMEETGDTCIRYDNKLIQASFSIFQACLIDHDFSDSTLETIVRTMTYAMVRRRDISKLVLRSTIFSSCIQIAKKSQEKVMALARHHVEKNTPQAVFQQQAAKINLISSERLEIYQFLGNLFCCIQLNDLASIEIVMPFTKDLIQIIYFQYSKIMIEEIKDKALIAAIQLEPVETKEKVILAVLFLQFNLFSFSPQIIEKFIEKNVFMYILGIWQNFSQLEQMIFKHPLVMCSMKRLNDIRQIQYAIISSVWNVLVQFRYPEKDEIENGENYQFKDRSEALELMTQYKQFGLVKMLVNYLKTVIYETDSINISKETVKFALFSLGRCFNFIIFSSCEKYLCSCLGQSSTDVSIVKQVLSRLMNSEHVFDEVLTEKALQCFELFDSITKNANHNEEQEFYDKGYHERPYESENIQYHHQYQGIQNTNDNGNWNNNQINQENQVKYSNSYNQGNLANWNHNENNQGWHHKNSEDVQI